MEKKDHVFIIHITHTHIHTKHVFLTGSNIIVL